MHTCILDAHVHTCNHTQGSQKDRVLCSHIGAPSVYYPVKAGLPSYVGCIIYLGYDSRLTAIDLSSARTTSSIMWKRGE